MTEPKITETLPAISFNAEELEAWVRGIVENYTGLVVTEDMVPAIKSEMAGLNKVRDRLEAARKEAVRRVSTPIREFEDRIKAITAVLVEARAGLDAQVKAFEERQREDKRREVEFLIRDTLDQNKVMGLEIQIRAAWLNKTTPLKTIKAEVEALILGHIQRERERAELEQARQDRAFAVENHLAAQNQARGTTVPVATFQVLIAGDMPLSDVMQAVTDHCARQHAQNDARALRQAQQAGEQPTPLARLAPGSVPPAPSVNPRRLTINAVYEAARIDDVRAAVNYLRNACTACDVQVFEITANATPRITKEEE